MHGQRNIKKMIIMNCA